MDKPDKRLKVALLFSGQPRYLDNPYPRSSHKKHIIDRYDTDVFCHTWWDKENECYPVGSWSTISKCDSSGKELEIIKTLLDFKESKEGISFLHGAPQVAQKLSITNFPS